MKVEICRIGRSFTNPVWTWVLRMPLYGIETLRCVFLFSIGTFGSLIFCNDELPYIINNSALVPSHASGKTLGVKLELRLSLHVNCRPCRTSEKRDPRGCKALTDSNLNHLEVIAVVWGRIRTPLATSVGLSTEMRSWYVTQHLRLVLGTIDEACTGPSLLASG